MHIPATSQEKIFTAVVVLAIPVIAIIFLLYRVLRYGYAFAPWQENADQRFGSKNFEPPIELGLGDIRKDKDGS